MILNRYLSGDYLSNNPTWHTEDSPWKAGQILRALRRNKLRPRNICEVGCGAGAILEELQQQMDPACYFWGYEVSPQAFELCRTRANQRLQFAFEDFTKWQGQLFDLVLVMDVIEHLEDYFDFLRAIITKGEHKLFHIPLEVTVNNVLNSRFIKENFRSCGHLHHFSKDIAIQNLKYLGYTILDAFYTPWFERPGESSFATFLIRKLLFGTRPDFAVKILGGCSLMILAK
jgi:hypothetical protein